METILIPAYDRGPEVCGLIREYIDAQLLEQPNFRGYLTRQHYEEELLHPEQKYGMPDGRLYILLFARTDEGAECTLSPVLAALPGSTVRISRVTQRLREDPTDYED